MKIMKKNRSMDNPILPEVYRRMGINLENLIFKELVEENSIPTKNLTITIASYDEYLLRTLRKKQINWTYIHMLSKPMLLSKLGLRACDHQIHLNYDSIFVMCLNMQTEYLCIQRNAS